jgi:RNA polymerase sigma factor (sigma-70 family)
MKGLRSYLKEAQGIIVKWGPVGLLYDDECIGYVAGKLMEADWKYDPDKGASETTWRILCGRWAIYNWLRDKKRDARRSPMSLNSPSAGGESELWETIEDKRKSSEQPFGFSIEGVLSQLTKTQKEYVIKHFKEGSSMSEIGKEKGISRQAVSIAIKSAIEKIKSEIKKERIRNEAKRTTSR